MVRNLRTVERVLRIVIGFGILGLFGVVPTPWRYLTLVGMIPLGTGLMGQCPVYRSLGWKAGS